jgi:hypothetical protein
VDPARPLVLRTHDNNFFKKEDQVVVSNLADASRRTGGV